MDWDRWPVTLVTAVEFSGTETSAALPPPLDVIEGAELTTSNTVKPDGFELPPSGVDVLQQPVPAGVPSVTHSSVPWEPSLAEKISSLPSTVKPDGVASPCTVKATVPAAVPSVAQS